MKSKNQVEETGIQLRNSLEVVELQMAEPTLDDTMPDVERLTRALRKFMNLKRIRVPYAVLRKLPDVLRASKFSVKCVVRVTPDDMFVYDIFDAKEDVIMGGLAVDIGTTTVSAVIINMATGEILAKSSSGNGQIRYGADVINRIIETTNLVESKTAGCSDQRNDQPDDSMRCAEAFTFRRTDLSYVCGIQYDNEPSVCRN